MKRGRLPLTALRSFEAAGRLRSFTLAADELCVSQAAVSRQVRELETLVGRPLFRRGHRQVEPTAEGAELTELLSASFDAMEARLAALGAGPASSQVRISAEPSFAACWLVPRLEDFRERHPEIDIHVESDARLVGFRRGEPELAVRHAAGAPSWPGAQSRFLVEVRLVAVAAPALLARAGPFRGAADLLNLPLLHEENRDFWRRWFEAAGTAPDGAIRGPVYGDGGLLMQGALTGQGAALLDEAFVASALAQGTLVRLGETWIPWGSYRLVARDFARLPPAARRFARWIEAALVPGAFPVNKGSPETP